VRKQPKWYFGDGSEGDLLVEGVVTLQTGVRNYRNVTVKKGGKLELTQQGTHIVLVSGVFEVEKDGIVSGISRILRSSILDLKGSNFCSKVFLYFCAQEK
jgi:hypothetical protein